MSRPRKKKFSINQPVVFRYSDRKLVGKVSFIRPVGKKFIYDVMCEDGKEYYELSVDSNMNQCIDTYLTKLFYKKYNIDENAIPEIENEEVSVKTSAKAVLTEPDLIEEDTVSPRDEGVLFDEEDVDFS